MVAICWIGHIALLAGCFAEHHESPAPESSSEHRGSSVSRSADNAGTDPARADRESNQAVETSSRDKEVFIDATAESGIEFVHFNGTTGEFTLPEITGSGCALADYDNDGDLDVYLVQGAKLKETAPLQPDSRTDTAPPCDRLLRNDSSPDGIRFTDVTVASGIQATGYGMGVATGDYNDDGWIDLYVTNLGSNQLWRNNADGTFTDVAAALNVDDVRWSTSATFLDYDRDGRLDLFVANYVDFSPTQIRHCYSSSSAADFCGPDAYDAVPDRLFRNLGDKGFQDVTGQAGLSETASPGLGVVAADFDEDGWIDLCVANDGRANQLWINQQGNGTFLDQSLLAGVAVNRNGIEEAGMGLSANDFDGDGDLDLVMLHLENESSTLYENLGNGYFEDRTIRAGLHGPTLRYTSFGGGFLDYDNDGWLDLIMLNGAVRIDESFKPNPFPLQQPNQLFRNQGLPEHRKGPAQYVEVTRQAGKAIHDARVSRGAAFGDVDNDGDTDVVVLNNNGPAQLLLNDTGNENHWLGIRVMDSGGRRDALQARVEVRIGKRKTNLWRRVHTDSSYCSASDPRVLVGLGDEGDPATVRVHWPDGKSEEYRELTVDRYWIIRPGQPVQEFEGTLNQHK